MNNSFIKPPTNKGAALLLFIIFFLVTSLLLVLSIGRSVYDDLVGYRILEAGKQSLYGAESGIEDAVYRHRKGKNYSSSETFTFAQVTVNVTRTNMTDTLEFVSEGNARSAIRKSKMVLALGDGASFNFGLQSGNGGIEFFNSSSVVGNVFSNGTIEGSGNNIFGDVVSAGPGGLVDSVHATGSVWSHSINNATIDNDAYYFSPGTKTGTIVGGISFPGALDEATATLPISDSQIEDWKTAIETTGTVIASSSPQCISGTYTIDTATTLNNVRIECNVIMKKQGASTVITIAGPVWIEGNLDFDAGPSIVASSSLGSRSVQVIVDKETNRTTSSKISINQATEFTSGNTQSYVILVSMNNSAESGGSEIAINLGQSGTGKVLLYASHGLVDIGQSTSLKEVTAYQIALRNTAVAIYESGLASLLFTSGPGGGYTIFSWREIE